MKRIDALRERLAEFKREVAKDLAGPVDAWNWQPSEGDFFDRESPDGGSFYRCADGSLVVWRTDRAMVVLFGPWQKDDGDGFKTIEEHQAFVIEVCGGKPLTAAAAADEHPLRASFPMSREDQKWWDRMSAAERRHWELV